jgi:hypothetical protein
MISGHREASVTAQGSGWERLAQAVSDVLPPAEVDGVWIFAPLRHEDREWGTAVLSRVDGERRRIYTACYVLAVKGKQRGKFESTVEEVGSGPLDALARVLQEAQRRIDDEHPPSPVAPDQWFSGIAAPADGSPR